MSNPILSAPAVRGARDAVTLEMRFGSDMQGWVAALDAYAAAILSEVKRRVEALEQYDPMPYSNVAECVPDPFGNYLDRAAVLRVLDGGEA